MPPVGSALNDEQIAAVLTYVRREWGQTAHAGRRRDREGRVASADCRPHAAVDRRGTACDVAEIEVSASARCRSGAPRHVRRLDASSRRGCRRRADIQG